MRFKRPIPAISLMAMGELIRLPERALPRHWCWYASNSGRFPAEEELLEIRKRDRIAAKAVAKLFVNMTRLESGKSRDVKGESIGARSWELKVRVGSVQLRLLHLGVAEHLVAVTALVKDTKKLEDQDLAKVHRADSQWAPPDCTGILSSQYLI